MIERLELSNAEYRALSAVSQSDLKSCWNNPQLYHQMRGRPSEPTASQQFGIDLESYIRGELDYAILPATVLNKDGHRRGKAYTEFLAENQSRYLVTEDYVAQLERAADNILNNGPAAQLIYSPTAIWHERFAWDCDLTGLRLKCEIDLLDPGLHCVTDLKTASDVDLDSFERDVMKWGYDIQAAMYLQAAKLLLDEDWSYAWVVVRNRPPFDCEVYEASQQLLLHGSRRLDERLEFFAECEKSGQWLSQTHGIVQTVYPPRWSREYSE